MTEVQQILFKYQDTKYADFSAKLIPTLSKESFIGVRTPNYKSILKTINDMDKSIVQNFLNDLPHQYHEENCLHVTIINNTKDFDTCLKYLSDFLPYINNWAVSDGLRPKVFEKNTEKLYPHVEQWIQSSLPYTQRVGMLFVMKYYLGNNFNNQLLDLASLTNSQDYYVNMMLSWLFAEALVKQWDNTLPYLLDKRLNPWAHNKTIQKAIESYRITQQQKEYLKTLKVEVSDKYKIKKP